MGRMNFRWQLTPPQPLLADSLARALRISPLLAQCLINRGLTETGCCRAYLEPKLARLQDPFALPGMVEAVDRLEQARLRGERVVLFGDYDVDGVTATALLQEVLEGLGWSTAVYLPHRLEEGYGLSPEAVANCLARFPTRLLLAVDCGSTSFEVIRQLQDRGVDVLVVDHHQVSQPAPPACALVNPRVRTGPDAQPVPFGELCSVGLAFKLAHALVKRGRQQGRPEAAAFDLRPLLDLVALGTIADVVPLSGENRILVKAGLARLNATRRPGLQALCQVARCPEPLDTYEVGFQLAPRLNAAGRLETAEAAFHLLRARSPMEAGPLADQLNRWNRDRQALERRILEQVLQRLRDRFNPETDYVIVEGHPDWHLGVVGIVAARIVQEFYRPTLILGGDGETWRGSGRSIPGFDLAAALRRCSDLLLRHGGHAMAAGVSVLPRHLDALRVRLNELARQALAPEALQPVLRIDAEVALHQLTTSLLCELDRLRPFGLGNPTVQLAARALTHHRPLQRFGPDRQHVRLWVTDGTAVLETVWWNGGDQPLPVGRFDLAFVPQWRSRDGQRTVQLRLLDWRPAA
jgi:single-stranded-DNA-specific exonuclease